MAKRRRQYKRPPQRPAEAAPDEAFKVTPELLAMSRRRRGAHPAPAFFTLPKPPPGAVPEDTGPTLATDSAIGPLQNWAAADFGDGVVNGSPWLGYPALSILATLPEYRRMAEVLATECTRNWIKFKATTDDKDAQAKIAQIEAEWRRMDVRGAVRRLIELDAFFGRAHLYIDTGQTDNRPELATSIGNGRDDDTRLKFRGRKGFLRGVKPMEPIWVYPSKYDATDPLSDNWYNPQTWFVQGKELHKTRILRFVGREVPDLLKPTYMFGGVSLSQLMKPYVDRWSDTVQAIADLIVSFAVKGLKTDMSSRMAPGGDAALMNRAEFFNNLVTNQGLMLLKNGAPDSAEDFFNVVTPLGTLDALMAKMQETLCSISGEPVVKLLGIQPAGMNASSEGELSAWYEWVAAFQPKFVGQHLDTLLAFTQLSLWGEIDPQITYEWEPIEELNAKEEAERRKIEAETDGLYVEMGALGPNDVRERIVNDVDSPYAGLEGAADLGDGEEGELGEEGGDAPDLSAFLGQAQPQTPREERLERTRPRERDEGRARDPQARRDGRTRERFDGAADEEDWRAEMERLGLSADEQPRDADGKFATSGQIVQHVTKVIGSKGNAPPLELGQVSGKNADLVRRHTGVDISGHNRVMETSDIRHALKEHGDPVREAGRGQQQLKKADFALIPHIVENAHKVNAEGDLRGRKGLRLGYEARVGDNTYHYVEHVRPDKKIVALKTMRKA